MSELVYPETAAERDRWIVAERRDRAVLDPLRPYAFVGETERSESGEVVPVSTVFLTNRECPWRCAMCDLWRNTLTETVPIGAIPEQIRYALGQLPAARHAKLYNSGSFFDTGAIPPADYGAIAGLVKGFERVIVESHPALVGDRCPRFRDLLDGQLEVALGLETVHPEALERLNKRVTLGQFAAAAERLRAWGVALRVFVLLQPPFVPVAEALEWAKRSVEFAFDCGASVVTLIPTRGGNGAMERLREAGEFTPPSLGTFEQAVEYGIGLGRGRVFADLWEIARIACCERCGERRAARLAEANLTQRIPAAVRCEVCEGRS